MTFIGNKPTNKHECNHKDGNRENNNLKNLEWVTSSENKIHACINGLTKTKIQLKDSQTIRKMYFDGELSQQKIADKFGITQRMVSEIVLNKSWKTNNIKEKRVSNVYFTANSRG